jgi:hypothetical protein
MEHKRQGIELLTSKQTASHSLACEGYAVAGKEVFIMSRLSKEGRLEVGEALRGKAPRSATPTRNAASGRRAFTAGIGNMSDPWGSRPAKKKGAA